MFVINQNSKNYLSVVSLYIFNLVNSGNETLIKLSFQPDVDVYNLLINENSLLEKDLHLSNTGKMALVGELESFFQKKFNVETKDQDYLYRDYAIKDIISLLQ